MQIAALKLKDGAALLQKCVSRCSGNILIIFHSLQTSSDPIFSQFYTNCKLTNSRAILCQMIKQKLWLKKINSNPINNLILWLK